MSTSSAPLAYFITFSTYGTWHHGEDRGSVQRGTAGLLAPSLELRAFERSEMDQPPYLLDSVRRAIVLRTLQEVAGHRGWTLLAAHVRSNHVHVVVVADIAPERVMNDFKAYASRRLNEARVDPRNRKRWTRHGSTKYLWTEEEVVARIRYTIDEQGEPMALFVAEWYANHSQARP